MGIFMIYGLVYESVGWDHRLCLGPSLHPTLFCVYPGKFVFLSFLVGLSCSDLASFPS